MSRRGRMGWVLLCLVALLDQPAANPVTMWGGSADDWALGVAPDAAGNLYLAGGTTSFGSGQSALLIKYDPDRTLQWARVWDGPGDIDVNGFRVTATGDAYLAGCTLDTFGDCIDVLVLKYDTTGALLWAKTWDADRVGDEDWADAIDVDSAGNVYATGSTDAVLGRRKVLLLKYDSAGTLLWARTWERTGGSEDSADYLAVDAADNVVLSGYSRVGADTDALVLKLDPAGNVLWAQTWGGAAFDDAFHVTTDGLGAVYATGETSSFGTVAEVPLLKLDAATGNLLWSRVWRLPGMDMDGAEAVSTDELGNAYVTGQVIDPVSELPDAFLLKFDAGGTLDLALRWGDSGAHGFGGTLAGPGAAVRIGGFTSGGTGAFQDAAGSVASGVGSVSAPAGTVSLQNGSEPAVSGTSIPAVDSCSTGCGADALLLELTRTCIVVGLDGMGNPDLRLAKGECSGASAADPYDLIRGDLDQLQVTGGSVDLGTVECVKGGLDRDRYTDLSPDPSAGTAGFFLAGNPGFGESSDGEPRDVMSPDPACP